MIRNTFFPFHTTMLLKHLEVPILLHAVIDFLGTLDNVRIKCYSVSVLCILKHCLPTGDDG